MYQQLKDHKIDTFISLYSDRLSWYHISHHASLSFIRNRLELPWDWHVISSRIDFEFVLIHPKLEWNWFTLSERVSWDLISSHLELPWNWDGVSRNPDITMEMIQKHPELPWNSMEISSLKPIPCDYELPSVYHLYQNPNIDIWDFIELYPYRIWYQFGVSSRSDITWDRIQQMDDSFWDWDGISMNPNMTINLILDYPNKPWNWKIISERMSWDVIKQFPDLPWNWDVLSEFKSGNIKDLLLYFHDQPWDWIMISHHPDVTEEIIDLFPEKPWDWYMLSWNLNISWERFNQINEGLLNWKRLSLWIDFEIIQKHKKPWDSMGLSKNPTIPISWLLKSGVVDWKHISQHPQLTMEHVLEYPDQPWDIFSISIYLFEKHHLIHPELKEYMNQFVFHELVSVCYQPDRLKWVLDEDQKQRWKK